jgi:hypothetical protein
MNTNESQIWARDSLSLPLSLGGTVPNDIQWMPPGEHQITALKSGEPVTLTVRVHAGTAERMNRLLQDLRAKAAAGAGDYPYFDFNHDDGEASGRPLEFYWAGDDLKTGGVRAKAEWSDRTQQSLSGKVPGFRRFSPSFTVDAAGEVTGAPLNMGGLVNRAAFKTIQPIVAGGTAPPGDANQRKANMDTAEKLAADLAAANQRITELQTQLSKAQSEDLIKAKDGEITTLKAKITTLEGQVSAGAKASAKAIVDAAVKAGKLAPQNTTIQEKWINAIAADPSLAETLNAMAPNPALGTVVAAGAPAGTVTQGAVSGEHQFVVKAKAFAAQQKITFADATSQIAGAEPALYEDYRRSLSNAAAARN